MAHKYREDLVGKRFLAVSGVTKINVNKVSEWGWKAGVIRAASLKDNKHKELQVKFPLFLVLPTSYLLGNIIMCFIHKLCFSNRNN